MRLAALLGLLLVAPWATAGTAPLATPAPGPRRVTQELPATVELPRSEPGTWDGFFVDHEPDPARVAALPRGPLERTAASQVAYGQRDFSAALRLSRGALEALPDFPPALLLHGTAAFRLRRHSDARAAFERLLEVAPTERWRTQALGHALYSLGEFEPARAHYASVLELLPDSREARRGLGLALYRLGREAEAQVELERVVAEHPDHGEAWTWLAQVRFDRGAFDPALAAAERAMVLQPYAAQPLYLAFRIHYELGEDAAAEAYEARWQRASELEASARSVSNLLLFAPTDAALLRQLLLLSAERGDGPGTRSAALRLLGAPAAEPLEDRLLAADALLRVGDAPAVRELLEALTAAGLPGRLLDPLRAGLAALEAPPPAPAPSGALPEKE